LNRIDEDGDMGAADDDLSWKVRKAAARCVSAIIKTRPEKL
jgi:cullin-associated NEDD8-dissociated protein 1